MGRAGATERILLAAGVIALAALIGYQTTRIPVSPLYAKIGPTVFPAIVTGGLLLLGIALLVQALRGGWEHDEGQAQTPADWRALGWVTAGLALNVALIRPLGFIIASTLLFCCVARGFGSARPGRDAATAIVFASAAYIGFDRILGLDIGSGLLERLL